MANQIKQADKLVVGAVSIFDKGIQDIAKANELISQSISEDESKIHAIAAKKEALNKEADLLHVSIDLKANKIKDNVDLLNKLSSFTAAN